MNEHLGGGTSFATQHGVKGLEFTQVLAVVSKGHNRFQIPEMLAHFSRRHELVGRELEAFVRARNLLYVACSRAREPWPSSSPRSWSPPHRTPSGSGSASRGSRHRGSTGTGWWGRAGG
ncbi:hypothetical protein ACFXC8_50475 [Streptomyces sp. NPDC059441]|uniref:hypothetical protein n=1 Tax=Streptomyces sp. NPDC059441 TaxID=3346829 RepID=UPI00367E287E